MPIKHSEREHDDGDDIDEDHDWDFDDLFSNRRWSFMEDAKGHHGYAAAEDDVCWRWWSWKCLPPYFPPEDNHDDVAYVVIDYEEDDDDVDIDDDGRAAPLIPDLHWPIDTISLTRQPNSALVLQLISKRRLVLVSVSVQLISRRRVY